MGTETNSAKLIRRLLSNKLDNKGKQELSQLDMVEKELSKQWNELDAECLDNIIREKIWHNIQKRCEKQKIRIVHLELWRTVAASACILLIIGGYWLFNGTDQIEMYREIVANESQMYTLPDSSKVWMRPGSSIRFAEDFGKNRNVWLKGNSLFEVRKQNGNPFKVYIDKAFIEVKGTSFFVKQNKTSNEVTLFTGQVDFYIEKTGAKIIMEPSQKAIYDFESGQVNIENVSTTQWKNGKFHFTNIHLEQLIQTINQLYSTNIRIESTLDEEAAFTGSIRHDEQLNDVVNKICFALNLHQKEQNGNITIYN